ncbi:hypothetical protein [Roseospira visakhapatnamensis]|uniref:Uncharacterized protein n=1 Tax=Roseospira visakhapatnamensis TaxID=390880 RepID=A0A7W6RCH9_9PROT|nr:hypothetical protein [Roseospira visakhapatnamensis]MBB4265975.1 hypothetical protein [Roseospira visakhapatnamensis]
MDKYCVNKTPQANGDHEVHKEDCLFWPEKKQVMDLGYHTDCHSAMMRAKMHYPQSNGCRHCCAPCHTT